MKYKKILILTNSSSGLYDFRKELIAELQKKYEMVAAVPEKDKVEELENMECRTVQLPVDRRGMNPIRDFKLLMQYIKLIKQENPEMVITYTIKPNIYGGLASQIRKVPYAVNITGLGTVFQKEGMLCKLVSWMYRISIQKAKVVFFENEENQKIFINKKIVKEKQACLLNGAGVNLEHFRLAEYPKDDKITRFLFIGRVMKEKGIEELFAAMRKLWADGFECSLDVLGSYEENYADKIDAYEKEGWLHYHGYQKDVRPFIRNCHCFVLPSWHEGMANTNLECAAMGRPVITSHIHGCMEAVEDGVSGYLCEKKNSDDLSQVMKKFVGLSYDERKDMGVAGRRRMELVFDKRKVVETTIKELEK